MQPLSGGKHPVLDKFLPGGILAIFVVLFLKPCGVFFRSSDALDSSREQGGEEMVLRFFLPACLPACQNGSVKNPKLRERAGLENDASARSPTQSEEGDQPSLDELFDPGPAPALDSAFARGGVLALLSFIPVLRSGWRLSALPDIRAVHEQKPMYGRHGAVGSSGSSDLTGRSCVCCRSVVRAMMNQR